MRTALASAAVIAGAAFMFAAALGVARLPDLYTRMQAATKAATVGVVGVMCGVAAASTDAHVIVRAALVSAFFLLTAPVGAHAIARSAHTRGFPLLRGTRADAWPWARGGGARRARPPGVRPAREAGEEASGAGGERGG